MKLIIGLALVLLSSTSSAALVIDPPLGLTWGSSLTEIESKTESLKKMHDQNERIEAFMLRNPHAKVNGFDAYSVLVDKSEGLLSVEMLQYFNNDANGTNIIKRYHALQEALRKKYETIDSIDFTSKPSPTFYKCIAHDSCGSMTTFVDGSNAKIQLFVMAGDKADSGQIFLMYRSNKYSEINEALKAKKDKDSADEIDRESSELSESL
ncbi:TPA: hypothetical protein QCI08_004222 [Enterobacter ludwigii]|nr:hypothetical protein [Enterobacter ludwigii]